MKEKKGLGKYFIMLAVLLILYYSVRFIPVSNKANRKVEREQLISENIRALEQSNTELRTLVKKDKEAINDFFFNPDTAEKIRGLINTYPTDRDLKISDNLIITLQKEGNPIRVRLFDSELEVINTRFNPTDGAASEQHIMDVKVVENPEELNHFQMIHYMRMYMVDTYGQAAFDRFLDETIEDQIKENKDLIKWIKQNYMEVEKLREE